MKLILTGSGKGFGRQYLEHLSDQSKYEIVALTRSLMDFSEEQKGYFFERDIELLEIDLSNLAEVESLVDQRKDIFANTAVLINNAGQRYRRALDDISSVELAELFNVNVISPIILAKACLNGMKERAFGKIINISSILGKSGLNDLSGYSATKGAIDSMTRSLAVELAMHNIQVNAVAPGFCKTSYFDKFQQNQKLHEDITARIPAGRWGEPDELNDLLDYLIFGQSTYITGQVIYIDGGWTAK